MELSFDTLDTPALTKAQLSVMLFDQLGLNKREAHDFIDAFFDMLFNELVEGQDVKISGFGNFEVRNKSARPGRNPRTGEDVIIPPRRVITFKASGLLKTQINQFEKNHDK
jgi:integration host factor subunit alpha